jgi:hypothetical protein
MPVDCPALWEPQDAETTDAFEAFVAYRDMGANRSVRRVAKS